MKRTVTDILLPLLMLGLYLVSGIGFGLHSCRCDGSVCVVGTWERLDCESIHGHTHPDGEASDHHGTACSCGQADCCCHTTVYQVLSERLAEDGLRLSPVQPDRLWCVVPPAGCGTAGVPAVSAVSSDAVKPSFRPPLPDPRPRISLWRI